MLKIMELHSADFSIVNLQGQVSHKAFCINMRLLTSFLGPAPLFILEQVEMCRQRWIDSSNTAACWKGCQPTTSRSIWKVSNRLVGNVQPISSRNKSCRDGETKRRYELWSTLVNCWQRVSCHLLRDVRILASLARFIVCFSKNDTKLFLSS